MNINDIKNKPHVKNSPVIKALKKQQAGIKTVMNDYNSTPLTDLFSMKSVGGREDDRKLSGLVKTAVLETSKLLGQFDFPIAPKLYVTRVRNVKFAKHDESEVVSGQIMINCKMATLSGVDLDAEIPVAISRGEVVPPSVLYHDGREYVMAQSTVDMLTQRNTSYALPQLRPMHVPPYNKDEARIAVELRNSVGYQPRKPEYPNEKHPVTRTRDRRPRLASKGAPAGYKIVTDAMDEAQKNGLDTFPRSIYYLLGEYIRPIMGEVYQGDWEIPLVNDGYCLNSYGPNRGRAKTGKRAQDSEKSKDDILSEKAWDLGVKYGEEHRLADLLPSDNSEEMHQDAMAMGCPYMYFDVFKYGAQSVWRERGEIGKRAQDNLMNNTFVFDTVDELHDFVDSYKDVYKLDWDNVSKKVKVIGKDVDINEIEMWLDNYYSHKDDEEEKEDSGGMTEKEWLENVDGLEDFEDEEGALNEHGPLFRGGSRKKR